MAERLDLAAQEMYQLEQLRHAKPKVPTLFVRLVTNKEIGRVLAGSSFQECSLHLEMEFVPEDSSSYVQPV